MGSSDREEFDQTFDDDDFAPGHGGADRPHLRDEGGPATAAGGPDAGDGAHGKAMGDAIRHVMGDA
eukprot:1338136-Pyramimonas_sp.AAC.1